MTTENGRRGFRPGDILCSAGHGGTCGIFIRFCREKQIEESLFKAVLHKMGFERVHFEKRIEDLSAGQKKKVPDRGKSLSAGASVCMDEPLKLY